MFLVVDSHPPSLLVPLKHSRTAKQCVLIKPPHLSLSLPILISDPWSRPCPTLCLPEISGVYTDRALEPSWRWEFDPSDTFSVDLYHHGTVTNDNYKTVTCSFHFRRHSLLFLYAEAKRDLPSFVLAFFGEETVHTGKQRRGGQLWQIPIKMLLWLPQHPLNRDTRILQNLAVQIEIENLVQSLFVPRNLGFSIRRSQGCSIFIFGQWNLSYRVAKMHRIRCKSLSTKDPLIIGLFCRK